MINPIYKYLAAIYSFMTFYFLYLAMAEGYEAIFDTTKPSSGDAHLRLAMIPLSLKSYVTMIFAPNYLFCQFGFMYFIYRALKRGERTIAFGAAFTMLSILYTNSYQFFHWKYWVPLNAIADLFELIRLNYVQRKYITHELVDLAETDLKH